MPYTINGTDHIVEIDLVDNTTDIALWDDALWEDAIWGFATTWTEVTDYVMSLSTSRGSIQNGASSGIFNGSCSITLDNTSMVFGRNNVLGPYFGQLQPWRKVRIRSTDGTIRNGQTGYTNLFEGYIQSWETSYPSKGSMSVVTINCVDALAWLARIESQGATTPVGAGEYTGQRVTRILNNAGFSGVISGERGLNTMPATDLSGSAITEIEAAIAAEGGEAYIDVDGSFVFRSRTALINPLLGTSGASQTLWGTHDATYLRVQSGYYATSPDTAALDITGDIELVVRCSLDSWASGGTIVGKWDSTTNNRSFTFDFTGSGMPRFNYSTNGTTVTSVTVPTVPELCDGETYWLKVVFDVSNSGNNVLTFAYAEDESDEPSTWFNYATVTTAGVASLYSSSGVLSIGSKANGTTFSTGNVYRVIVRNGIAGTTVFDADFTYQTAGVTALEDATGKSITLTNASQIVTQRTAWHYADIAQTFGSDNLLNSVSITRDGSSTTYNYSDDISVANYGLKRYSNASLQVSNDTQASKVAAYLLDRWSDCQEQIGSITLFGHDTNQTYLGEELVVRNLRDRVTINQLYVVPTTGQPVYFSRDFFIDSIEHSIDMANGSWLATFGVSPAPKSLSTITDVWDFGLWDSATWARADWLS